MQLIVRIDGATPEEVHRGGLAAMALFSEAGVTPYDAAAAAFAREGWDMSDFADDYDEYTDEDAAIAHLWDAAAVKAAEVASADWPADRVRPPSAVFEIVP